MATSKPVDLYYSPPSYYSLLVLLAIEEKKIPKSLIRYHILSGHEPLMQPWFARINPHMQVPAIKHGDFCLPDSGDIIEYLEKTFPDSVKLWPDAGTEDAARCDKIMKLINTEPDGKEGLSIVYLLTYGTAHNDKYAENPKIPRFVFRFMRGADLTYEDSREAKLRKFADSNPDLRDVYLEKIRTSKIRFAADFSEENYLKCLRLFDEILTQVEQELGTVECGANGDRWVCGERFSLADIHLFNLLSRIDLVGLSNRLFLKDKPLLTAYYAAFQKRESARVFNFSYYTIFGAMLFKKACSTVTSYLPVAVTIGAVVTGCLIYRKYWT